MIRIIEWEAHTDEALLLAGAGVQSIGSTGKGADQGFRLGEVGFHDFLLEALDGGAIGVFERVLEHCLLQKVVLEGARHCIQIRLRLL